MKRMKEESGQTLILVALSFMICILGFVGIAADVGVLLHAKRNLQSAADAAAIAGAKEIRVLGAGVAQIKAAGQAASAQNGFTDGANGISVAVNPPPLNGPHAGAAGYVEAIVRQTKPLFFMKLLGITSMPVVARAVAFNGANFDTLCIDALNPTAADTIHLQGSFNVNVPGCQVVDDSNNANALVFTGAGGTLTAGGVGVVGGATGQTGDSSPAPVKIAPVSDPLAPLISPPDPSTWGTCSAAPMTPPARPAPQVVQWQPNANGVVCYSGSPTIGAGLTVNMSAGTYVFTGTLDLSGHGTLTGTGVTIYLPPPTKLPTTIPVSNQSASGGTLGGGGNGNTTLTLTAPSDPANPYNHILIYEDAGNTNNVSFNGTPVATLTGIIYAPSAELDLSGNTNMNLTTDLIVGSLYDKGNATINLTDLTQTVTDSPLNTIALVE